MQMYMAPLIFLVTTCDSLRTMVEQSGLTGCPGVAVLVDRGRGLEMFFEPVPKCPTRFSNLFFGAVCMWAFEFVDNPTISSLVSMSLVHIK